MCAHAWRMAQPTLRRAFATEPKSMLGGRQAGMAPTTTVLESAAEARLAKLKAQGLKAEGVPDEPPKQGVIGSALGVLADAIGLSVVGAVCFTGYASLAYESPEELQKAVDKAKASLEAAEPPPPPPPPAPSAPGAPPPPPTFASSAPPKPAVEPASFPLATKAWVWCAEQYVGTRGAIERQIKSYTDPTYHKLLPDLAPQLRGSIKTLVLDLDDLLVHKEWTRQSGWQLFKRPGVTDFLMEMAGYYEIVVFTDEPATYAAPILDKLDPHRAIMYRLYRPDTQYHEGKHVRDLSKLNREMSQVLMLSSKPEAWSFQPENCLKLKPWIKDHRDTTLLDLIPMLQLVSTRGVKDVRDVVKSYDGEENIPAAFKARMSQASGHQKQHRPRLLSLAK